MQFFCAFQDNIKGVKIAEKVRFNKQGVGVKLLVTIKMRHFFDVDVGIAINIISNRILKEN